MSSQEPVSRQWSPIEDLPEDWRETLVDKSVQAAMQAWIDRAEELRQSEAYKEFTERLHRRWSIETGIIEDAYTVSRSATETLIQHGLDAALISHEDVGNEEPIEVLRKIEDHQRAIQGLYSFASDQRPLGVSFIRELHQVLMAHQQTYLAVDQFGNRGPRQLKLGDWKTWPNHVDLPGGGRFEYCPPEQVASEMDQLVEWHRKHLETGVPPDIEAAWLHHRFTLIHPFEDGNGRVARTLATMVLLKGRWLPMVIDRKEKPQYIDAIRKADKGDLQPLVRLVNLNQIKEVRTAASLSIMISKGVTPINERIKSIANRLTELADSNAISHNEGIYRSSVLWTSANQVLKQTANDLNEALSEVDRNSIIKGRLRAEVAFSAYSDYQANLYTEQLMAAASTLGYSANWIAHHQWCALSLNLKNAFKLIFSFHAIGQAALGLFGCLPFVYKREGALDDRSELTTTWSGPFLLSESPFEFVDTEDVANIVLRFDPWLEARISEALAIWERDL
ncbi:Fic family protein [Planctopirus hydrillae]|uniref:Fido domain-containing protein n=1 Tax=Planctopirus hydrillae TaxID=1841610 RepID=A0A1C3ETF1_9PLAN|nr:Fic family protein [Planctopirus hydrillae]ODA36479.1 hypothetical protein A6X21_01990 [Planctopirus hydrillae]